MFNLWSVFEEIGKDIITYGHGVYFETGGEQPMIKFIKLTGADDKKDVYVNVNKINAISSQNKRIRVVCISDQLLLVLETVEEILAKIEEVTK